MRPAAPRVLWTLLAAAVLSLPVLAAAPSGTWTTGVPLPTFHSTTPGLVRVGGVLYYIGGSLYAREYQTVLAYDSVGGTWTYKNPMPTARQGFFAGAISTTIYVAGGYTNNPARTAVVEAYDTVADSWTTKTSMPAAMSDGAFAVYNGKLYALSGAVGGSCVSNAYVYDPVGDSWTALTSDPTARCHARAAVYGAKIFVMGGSNTAGTAMTTAESYDPVGNSWATLTGLQTARYGGGVAVSSGSVYIVGGYNGSTMLSTVESYLVSSNTWSYKSSIPAKREAFALDVGADGRFYAVGGVDNSITGGDVTEVDAYDPIGDAWSVAATHVPGPRRDAAAVAISSTIFVVGGQSAEGSSDLLQVYGYAGNVWGRGPAAVYELPAPRYGPAAAAVNGALYVAGGMATSTAPASNVWSFDAVGGTWTARAPLPTAGGCGASGVINRKLYVLTSCDGTGAGTKVMAVYDPAANTWTTKTPAPNVHRYPAFGVVGGKLLVAGGSDTTGTASATLDAYDPVLDAWTTLAPMPTARIGAAGGAQGGTYLTVAGGTNGSGTKVGTVEVYDAAANTWSTGPSLTTARSDLAAAVVGANLFAIGGQTAAGDSDVVESFTVALATAPTVATVSPSSAATGTSLSVALTGAGLDGTAALSLERPDATHASWTAVSSMTLARAQPMVVRLQDGRVLFIGGRTGGITSLSSAEIYDPPSGNWVSVASMTTARYDGVPVLLNDGRVLVVGGRLDVNNSAPTDLASCEIYDPVANTWTPTGALAQARSDERGFLRPDGKVFIAGGFFSGTNLASAEIYDPATGTWSAGPAMSAQHNASAAAVLKDGRFLLTGGSGAGGVEAVSEIYDPVGNAWTTITPMATARYGHTLTVLADGRVLAAGGSTATTPTATAEIYDPAVNTWMSVPNMADAHSSGTSALLGGLVLVAGGSGNAATLSRTDVFDPAAGVWSTGPALSTQLVFHGMTALPDGRILLAGGAAGGFPSPALAGAQILSATWTAIVATGVSVPDAQHASGSLNLTGAATGYWDVVVRQSGGRVGRLVSGFRVRLVPPPAPPTLTSVSVAPLSVTLGLGTTQAFAATGFFSDGSTQALNGAPASWVRGAGLLQARLYATAATVNGRFYVIGGYTSPTTEMYDPATGVWTSLAPPPVDRALAQATAVGTVIYVYGGCINADCNSTTAATWAYDTVANTWSSKAAMPAARQGMSADVIGGKIYVAGGYTNSYVQGQALTVYDPVGNTWTAKASLPAVRAYGGVGAIGTTLYYAGGTNNGFGQPFAPQTNVWAYDSVADTWTSRASLPIPLGEQGSGAFGNRLYMVDGSTSSAGAASSGTWVYDPSVDAWSAGPATNDSRTLPAAAIGGSVFFTAGDVNGALSTSFESSFLVPGVAWSADAPWIATVTVSGLATAVSAGTGHVIASSGAVTGSASVTVNSPGVPTVSSITLVPSSATLAVGGAQAFTATGHMSDGSTRVLEPGAWTRGQPTRAARQVSAGAFANGKYYAIGGNGTQTMEAFDPATSTWTTVAAPPTNLGEAKTVVVSSLIYVVGGCVNSDCTASPTAAVWAYDTVANSWSAKASMPAARQGMMLGLIGGKVYAAGGYTGNYVPSSDVLAYDVAADSWTTRASMPAVRAYAAGGAVAGKLYVAAGTSSGFAQSVAPHTELYVYDPAVDTWTTRAPVPAPRAYPASGVLDGKIYMIDGADSTGTVHSTLVYDPVADTWTAGPTSNDAREFPASGAGNGALFLSGNLFGNVASSSFEFVSPAGGVVWSSDAPSVATVTASGLVTGVSSGTAHAVAAVGAVNASATVSVVAASALSGAAQSATSIRWSWATVAGVAGFRVVTSTSGDRSGALAPSATTWLETGLAVNTATTRRLLIFDAQSSTSVSAPATVYTLANPPTGSAASVFVSSAALSWALNGNPSSTLASVERSTASGAFAVVFSSNLTSYTDTTLAACTTYYYRVRDFNGDAFATVYDATVTVHTTSSAPLPPSVLTAQALTGGTIALAWTASPSAATISSYYLFASTGVLTYGTPYAVIPATATSYTTPVLSTATVVRFGLRAYSACAGADDGNTNVVASATPLVDASGVRAAISEPQSGKKVSGNSVTVRATIVSGDPHRVRDVRFQFRNAASTSAAFVDITASDLQHPNPASVAPYFIHWDVTGLPNASYELRAVAELTDSTVDPSPQTVVIGVDAVNHDSDETVVSGSEKKDETVYSGAQGTVGTADNGSGEVVEVTLPVGCVNASTDTLSLYVNPPGAPAAGKNQVALGQNLQITLGSGQTSLNGTATIVMHYQDDNDDGIIDGTSYRVDKIAIFSYNVGQGAWVKESNTVVDRTAKTLTATTPHFSLFGLFAVASADLSSVTVYPVPWLPNAGNPNTGKPFNSGDTTSGIVFDNLTDNVRIQVFSASGSLVWDYSTQASGGRVQWDGRGTSGRDAASGGYLSVITDRGSGSKVVRKIAIIR